MDNTQIEPENNRECNTCHWYEPEEGTCIKKGEYRHGYDGTDCPDWVDWEGAW